MHAVGLHSALAIKRQRKRRDEQRRARERRYSAQSGESGLTSPRASTGSLDHHGRHHKGTHGAARNAGQGMLDTKVVTSIGMLHIGVVFLVLGAFLLVSGLLPGDLAHWGTKSSGGWWNELVAVGLFAILVGIFLIVLNRVIAKKEEDDLEQYVQRQLTRSKSGHRLERDVETGGLTTRHARRVKQMQQDASDTSLEIKDEKAVDGSPPRSPPPAYSPQIAINGDNQAIQSALYLEQITEEEIISDRVETSTTNSLSPGSPSETRELLQNVRYSKQNGNPQQVHRPLYVSKI
ncbi:centrosomal protein [Lasius niger]|uniref:Centrosomal protein n=1 Tax=Lasius niger TaxID=67767 RepID=A0A0J7L5R7_LASNI|nr:centrosomal protein [Lasius niger]